jgi:HEAT repeat protein
LGMLAYCTGCWAEISTGDTVCLKCGANAITDPRSFDEKLLGALNHPLPETRVRICWLAGRRRMREAVPALLRLLGDPDLYVRMTVLEALGEIGEVATIPVLEAAARERSVLIQKAARQALLRIHGRKEKEPARSSSRPR